MPDPDLFSHVPKFGSNFDGATFEKPRDGARLNKQLTDVFKAMRDGSWRTLAQLHEITGHPEASISARMRDLRKFRNGSHTVERRYVKRGLFEYRLLERAQT